MILRAILTDESFALVPERSMESVHQAPRLRCLLRDRANPHIMQEENVDVSHRTGESRERPMRDGRDRAELQRSEAERAQMLRVVKSVYI